MLPYLTLCNELRNAYQILDSIDTLCELDTQICIFGIVARLPAWVLNRWDKNELKNKRSLGSYLKFADLCDKMGDPLCGSVVCKERLQVHKRVVSHAALHIEGGNVSSDG